MQSLNNRIAVYAFAIAFAAGVCLEAAVFVYAYRTSPSFVVLVPSHDADWIRQARPMDIALMDEGTDATVFEKRFTVIQPADDATLRFRALETARVYFDGELVHADSTPATSWKQWRSVDLSGRLTADAHTLRIEVEHENGPPLLQAYIDPVGLATGPDWRSSRDGQTWDRSATANRIAPVPGSRAFPSTPRSFVLALPILAPAFAISALAYLGLSRRRGARVLIEKWGLLMLRGAMLLGLLVLGVNNLYRVPAWFGFDVEGHMQYIHYIAQFGRLPLANEGWKMNEAPLFHWVSSIPYRFVYEKLTIEQNTIAMRIIPLLCGLAQIEIVFRTVRIALPGRPMAHALATAVCGLLPMNIYLSQFPSNQPFVGLWSALAVYICVRLMCKPDDASRRYEWALLGLLLGLAVLSKITALLVVPGALIAVAVSGLQGPSGRARYRNAAIAVAITSAVLAVVCGWYFVRNQLAIGGPFSVGYSESLGTTWRQDPGFRAPGQFLTFGEGLLHPVHASFVGYWDSIYSTFWSDGLISSGQVPPGYTYGDARPPSVPPWNFIMLGAATLLSLVPMTLIALGTIRALARPLVAIERGTLLSLFLIGTHLVAMIYLYVSLPMVSAGKAAYLLNLLPCFGILVAQGFESIERRRVLSAVLVGGVCAWGLASYLAFFAR